jgi:hypothetical protein
LKLAKLLSFILLIALVLFAKGKDEGFSGKWVLDKGSPRPSAAPNNLETKIKQDSSWVTIESSFREPDNGIVPLLYLGVMTTRMRLGANGDEVQNTIGPFQMASKTTINGNQMDTDWTAVEKGDLVNGHWTHKLSDDGRHMTLEIKESDPKGASSEVTLFFVRK